MESLIDQKYRRIIMDYYLENIQESTDHNGNQKFAFTCPFCGSTGRTEAKKKHRKAALLWNQTQNSWVFYCAKKSKDDCFRSKTLSNFMDALNPALAEAYRRERYFMGSTGKGYNCRAPRRIVGVSTEQSRINTNKHISDEKSTEGMENYSNAYEGLPQR